MENKYNIKIGDIFHAEFGYNTIMHDFYKVIGLKGAATVIVQELDTFNTSDDGYEQMGHLRPYFDKFAWHSKPETKVVKIDKWNNRPTIKMSNYKHAYLMTEQEYDQDWYFDYMD